MRGCSTLKLIRTSWIRLLKPPGETNTCNVQHVLYFAPRENGSYVIKCRYNKQGFSVELGFVFYSGMYSSFGKAEKVLSEGEHEGTLPCWITARVTGSIPRLSSTTLLGVSHLDASGDVVFRIAVPIYSWQWERMFQRSGLLRPRLDRNSRGCDFPNVFVQQGSSLKLPQLLSPFEESRRGRQCYQVQVTSRFAVRAWMLSRGYPLLEATVLAVVP